MHNKNKTWTLLVKIAAVVTIISAVGSFVVLLVKREPVIAGFVLIGSIALVACFGWWRATRSSSIHQQSLLALQDMVRREEWSLLRYLLTKPIRDTEHRYSLREEEYEFDEGKIILRWKLAGRIETKEETDWLPVKIVSDLESDFAFMDLNVFDAVQGQIIPIERLKIKHEFAQTLLSIPIINPPNHTFEIHLSCNLRAVGSENEYVFFPWGQFCTLGVDTLRARVISRRALREPELRELQAEYRSLKLEPPEPRYEANHWALDFEKNIPTSIYVLEFKIGV